MYEELVKKLRRCGKGLCTEDCPDWTKENLYNTCQDELVLEAADAIEELSRQRDRAYARLCEWCGVCPEGKRNAEDCEIAALNPEPPKEEAPAKDINVPGTYDLLYEEGGPDTR